MGWADMIVGPFDPEQPFVCSIDWDEGSGDCPQLHAWAEVIEQRP